MASVPDSSSPQSSANAMPAADSSSTPRAARSDVDRQSRRPRRRGKKRSSSQRPQRLEPVDIPSDGLTIADDYRLRRRNQRLTSEKDRGALERAVANAQQRYRDRTAALPAISFPPELPVSAARDEIAEAIASHQVVVVAGETGSGKTTQLPKICLELGRGIAGTIGHTQPRRIAARSVAARIAEETHTELGDAVGYSVRFNDTSSQTTLVKVMTDGILLAEIGRDPLLRAYDTIIVDEAHERSLTIDFLLGFLARLLPRRPDLKVIVTSATIDPQRFADHFAGIVGDVPVISVSGRTYPVAVRYRPIDDDSTAASDDDDDERNQIDAIVSAVTDLRADGPGDILVFLPTEREIRDTADALTKARPRDDILPLYSRLSTAEQNRVFTTSSRSRIVLSTNVAETSLTVPGIRYVIDTGTARISRYSMRTKVQRLPVEKISQASARQRAGRCGRVADGICIRLYSEDDFDARPAFTEPEILRTNLASVILTMAALGLGDIADFPFLDPPDSRSVRDGVALLEELGALSGSGTQRRITATGRDIASLPIDPRWAAMVVAAHTHGVLAEALVIVAAMSLPDVRERPAEAQGSADAAHARFTVPGSDFLSVLMLWRYIEKQRSTLSGNQFRKLCQREFLHWLRIREWRDLVGQLSRIVDDKGWQVGDVPETVNADGIHRSVLAGLLSHIGLRDGDTREFSGARGTRFVIFPGSGLAKKPPRFVMAGELVETSRLFARTVAGIEPEWVEKAAGDIAKRTYSEPHWSSKRGSAMAYERATVYGVPVVTRRAVTFGRIDPELSRELFIRHALVDGDWRTHHAFFSHNRTMLDDAREWEERARRGGLVITDDQLFDFYDAKIPADVVSAAHFDAWWKKARRDDAELLHLHANDVADTATVDAADFPDTWQQGEAKLALEYAFTPGTTHDGITVLIPQPLVDRIRPAGFDWLVPGLRDELAVALIRTLPKALRRRLPPGADIGPAAMSALTPRSEPVTVGMARELSTRTAVTVSANDFEPAHLPPHLRMRFTVVDGDGTPLASADSLSALSNQHRSATEPNTTPVAREWTADTFATLPTSRTDTIAGQRVTSYPMLICASDGVRTDTAATELVAQAHTHRAIIELLTWSISPLRAKVVSNLDVTSRVALSHSPYASVDDLLTDCMRAAVIALVGPTESVRDPQPFAVLRARVNAQAPARARVILASAAEALVPMAAIADECARLASSGRGTQHAAVIADVGEQLDHLIYAGFVSDTDDAHLHRLRAYLDAIVVRLQRLPGSIATDADAMAGIDRVVDYWVASVNNVLAARREAINTEVHWLVEELRIGLFAERIGSAMPISEKRVLRHIDALCR